MNSFQKEITNELKKIIKQDLPQNLNKEQKLKLVKIEKELCDNDHKC